MSSTLDFSAGVGWLGVCMSLACWGSFSSLTKTQRLRELNVNPAVMQVYAGVAVFFTSFLVLLAFSFSFSAFGLFAACLWVPGNCGFFTSIRVSADVSGSPFSCSSTAHHSHHSWVCISMRPPPPHPPHPPP
jgi:hypothetical protein